MTASAASAPTAAEAPQHGERATPVEQAARHARRAVADLGLTASLTPLPVDGTEPGAWRCDLFRGGVPVPGGVGFGKGPGPTARVGAVFEALEHHLGELPPPGRAVLRGAHQVAAALGRQEAVLARLSEGPDRPLACLPYRSLTGPGGADVPVFLSMPGYVDQPAAARTAGGDGYDYRVLGRYALNNGWAAGVTRTEAVVHALNEIIERDAMSLLLVRQFLSRTPPPLRVLDPAALPGPLAALHRAAEDRVGARVWLLEMTTDLGVPAYWAYLPAAPGVAARVRGCGASLSRTYAVERALHELVQIHTGVTGSGAEPQPAAPHFGSRHPALRRCYTADFSARLKDAHHVPFTADGADGGDDAVPCVPAASAADAVDAVDAVDASTLRTPADHLDALLARLSARGFSAYAWDRYTGDHLAVTNVFVPGMERFMAVTDGHLVLPGPRGLAART
ncbi:YcaO-like family protein [Streptomyces sp. NPDC056161]|uniref:YcaO-like family protein n=1 Tax=Streptomyces sp. NPDC056161 TaxID=3345732 RepID=UPI0035D97578